MQIISIHAAQTNPSQICLGTDPLVDDRFAAALNKLATDGEGDAFAAWEGHLLVRINDSESVGLSWFADLRDLLNLAEEYLRYEIQHQQAQRVLLIKRLSSITGLPIT